MFEGSSLASLLIPDEAGSAIALILNTTAVIQFPKSVKEYGHLPHGLYSTVCPGEQHVLKIPNMKITNSSNPLMACHICVLS